MRADADGLAGAGELQLLAEVAYAAGHLDVTIEAWERAHALSVRPATLSRRPGRRFASRCTCSWIRR